MKRKKKTKAPPITRGQCPGFGIDRASGMLYACRTCCIVSDESSLQVWVREKVRSAVRPWEVLPPLAEGGCPLCSARLGEPSLVDAEMAVETGMTVCADCAETLVHQTPFRRQRQFEAACNRRDPEGRCSATCAGWDLFNDNEIQRCDECAVFATDDDAIDEAIQHYSEVCGFNIECGKSEGHVFAPLESKEDADDDHAD
jgi:hypothetical protein